MKCPKCDKEIKFLDYSKRDYEYGEICILDDRVIVAGFKKILEEEVK